MSALGSRADAVRVARLALLSAAAKAPGFSFKFSDLKFDKTPSQLLEEKAFALGGKVTPKTLMLADITARMIDKNSNATRLVEKLRLKGFVKREVCKNNRRQVDILITEKGITLLSKIDKHSEEWMETLKNISKTEAQDLNRILDKLRG